MYNKGLEKRRYNKAHKKRIIEKHCEYNAYCGNTYIGDEGYVKQISRWNSKQCYKKITNKKARALNRSINEDASANISRNKLFDYWWELF